MYYNVIDDEELKICFVLNIQYSILNIEIINSIIYSFFIETFIILMVNKFSSNSTNTKCLNLIHLDFD